MVKSVHDYQIDDVFKKMPNFTISFPNTRENIRGQHSTGKICMMIFQKMNSDNFRLNHLYR